MDDGREERLDMHQRTIRTGCLLTLLALGGSAVSDAQELEAAPTDLSLEDLLDLELMDINVLGIHNHFHFAGEWMVGYSPMLMGMDGNQVGTSSVSTSDVLQSFPVAPVDMTMEMHMLHLMYAPSDELTFAAMINYERRSMSHVTRMGASFVTESEGFGDLQLGATMTAFGDVRSGGPRILLNAAASLPTGSINERGATPMGADQKLPYPMQLGSGTFDILPGVVYLDHSRNWAWLAEARGVVRLGRNSNDYALGNSLWLTASVSRRVTDWFSVTSGLEGEVWGDVQGADPELNPMMVPTADPTLRGGRAASVRAQADFYATGGALRGQRLVFELAVPVYQLLHGPQLTRQTQLRVAWAWTL